MSASIRMLVLLTFSPIWSAFGVETLTSLKQQARQQLTEPPEIEVRPNRNPLDEFDEVLLPFIKQDLRFSQGPKRNELFQKFDISTKTAKLDTYVSALKMPESAAVVAEAQLFWLYSGALLSLQFYSPLEEHVVFLARRSWVRCAVKVAQAALSSDDKLKLLTHILALSPALQHSLAFIDVIGLNLDQFGTLNYQFRNQALLATKEPKTEDVETVAGLTYGAIIGLIVAPPLGLLAGGGIMAALFWPSHVKERLTYKEFLEERRKILERMKEIERIALSLGRQAQASCFNLF